MRIETGALTSVDHVTELELATPGPLELPAGVRTARVLVRLHGCPLGVVAVTGPGPVSVDDVLSCADEALQTALAEHQAGDAYAEGSIPPCMQSGPWPGAEGLVSVVVATRDRPEPLERALTSLLACRGSFEVIVVDSVPHSEAAAGVVERLADPRLRYLREHRPGLSRARNLGATHAQGRVLAFTDDDVTVDAGWVVALDRAFTLGPDVGVVTGLVPTVELCTDTLLPSGVGNPGTGANLAVRTRVFGALGGFDEVLDPGTPARGGEDLDLLARALLGGWAVRYEPSAVVWHQYPREPAELQHQRQGNGRGRTARSQQRGGEHGRAALGPSPLLDAEPALPVLELLEDGPLPDAAAPLLVTAHGIPLGLLPLEGLDPRQRALSVFAEEVDRHRSEVGGTSCGWAAQLGERRPGVTVVITTIGDRPETLAQVVDRLLAQSYQPLQVVVVDNRPGQWSRAGRLPDDPRLLVVEEGLPGISAARNAGLAVLTTPVVLFVDDDVLPCRDWAAWLVAALHATPETVCATGLILPLETRTRGQQLLEEWGGFAKGFRREIYRHPTPAPPHPLYPYLPGIYGSGANVGFWVDRLRSLGGYDEVLGAGTSTFGGEDLAIQMDVVLRGYDLVYEPAAVIWHRHHASVSDWRRQLFRYGAGLSAAMLRRAGRSAEDRREILRRLPAAAQLLLSPSSRKNQGRSAQYPRVLMLVELAGMAYGPLALVRSRLRLRRFERGPR